MVSFDPKIPSPLRLPGWASPAAANTDVELTAMEAARRAALDTAKRLGWRGVITGGEGVAVEGLAAEGIGATLWGIARIGLPILTLGLMMEGDEGPKPARAEDFPMPKPDKDVLEKASLDFLKQQKRLAELTGNTWLAQILDVQIQMMEAAQGHAPATPPAPLIGHRLQISATSSGGEVNSIPLRSSDIPDRERLSDKDRELWDELIHRSRISARSLYRYLETNKIPPEHPFLSALEEADPRIPATPDLACAVAWYRMLRLVDRDPRYIGMFNGAFDLAPNVIVKNIPLNHMPWLWEVLETVVARHKDPITRHYALEITESAATYKSRQVQTLRRIIETGLQDPEPTNVWRTWKIMHHHFPEEAMAVTDHDLAHPISLRVGSSPAFGLSKYVHGSRAQLRDRHEIFMHLVNQSEITEGVLSWEEFQPIHSLADFNPDARLRKSTVTHKQHELIEIGVALNWKMGPVLHTFLIGNDPNNWTESAKVIHLPSGAKFLVQAHHRVAALIDNARRGRVPQDWLDEIPAIQMHYVGEVPEAIIRRVLTLGIDLGWLDLFP